MKIDPRKIYPLKGTVQHYAWGGHEFIPALLGIDNTKDQPFAEYWMGAHRSAPSTLAEGEARTDLKQVLASEPALMGSAVQQRFGELPYLLKVLDVKHMLSIQVHPTREGAESGFAAEEAAGVDINASNRNYKDRNHKPEVMIALSGFWLLHGFKQPAAVKATLHQVPQFRELLAVFGEGNYKELYTHVMELPQQKLDEILLPVVQKEVRRRTFHESEPGEPGYWVGEYYLDKKAEQIDRGIFAIYLLNLVQLQAGEAIFQAAGIPHAYLRGQNIELMANSDNVLRGGLTTKHIDVSELVKHTRFTPVEPEILHGSAAGAIRDFRFPVPDFAVSEITLSGTRQAKFDAASPEILFCLEGKAMVSAANELQMGSGDSCIVFAGNSYIVSAEQGCRIFRAYVP
ncbi:MAG TPA: mannose-6-phosphate isomerase, class I [Chitinophagaceae bacterium]